MYILGTYEVSPFYWKVLSSCVLAISFFNQICLWSVTFMTASSNWQNIKGEPKSWRLVWYDHCVPMYSIMMLVVASHFSLDLPSLCRSWFFGKVDRGGWAAQVFLLWVLPFLFQPWSTVFCIISTSWAVLKASYAEHIIRGVSIIYFESWTQPHNSFLALPLLKHFFLMLV